MRDKFSRRDFVKTGIASVAAATVEAQSSLAKERGQKLVLENDEMIWEFSHQGKKLTSVGLKNKLSGAYFPLRDSTDLRLVFSVAKQRITIPWWRCTVGPDHDATPPDGEPGYRQGYHQPGWDDSRWGTCRNPCINFQLDAGSGQKNFDLLYDEPPATHRGYAWFRTRFELPPGARDEEVAVHLGGVELADWNEYWVYVNGVDAGRRSSPPGWRTPGQFRLEPGSEAHRALRFGPGEANVLAVRTRDFDRRIPGLNEDVMDSLRLYIVLYDQYLTVGKPFEEVVDFEVVGIRREAKPEGPELHVELLNRAAQVRAKLHYELRGPVRRKWAEVVNEASTKKLLLDVDLEAFDTEAATTDGGFGFPMALNEQVFAAVEYPSGLNRAVGRRVLLTHFPGRRLEPGESWRTHNAIVGVARPNQVREQFWAYLDKLTPRPRQILSLYCPFGITDFTDSLTWVLDDHRNLGALELLEKWQKRGLRFDYYVWDVSLDQTSDLKHFKLFAFPDGPGEVVQRIEELGMKFGCWMATCNYSNWRYPKTIPSRIPSLHPTKDTFRHGYANLAGASLCLASEPYLSIFKEAVLYQIRENHVRFLKFDGGVYHCDSTEHEHLPGKYSTEANINRIVDVSKAARAANPNIFIDYYVGGRTPFLLLYGDATSHLGLRREAASTADTPVLFFRDGITQAQDQTSQYAKWIPPRNRDTFGIWLTECHWGGYLGADRLPGAVLMDLARGHRLFPQIWGNLFGIEDQDVEVLARLQKVVKQNEPILQSRQFTIGDPWKDEIYGYSYFTGQHGFIFLNNVSFDARRIGLSLDASFGLQGPAGEALCLRTHYPGEALLGRRGDPTFRAGETVELQLRPFEVMMLEVLPRTQAPTGLAVREVVESTPVYSYRIPTEALAGTAASLEIDFADANRLAARGCQKQVSTFKIVLPNCAEARYHLAIVNMFKRNGKWWRQEIMSEYVQAIGRVGDFTLEFARTPEYRQCGNSQWAPWIVFSTPVPRRFAGKPMEFGVTTYLPEGVEMSTDVWAVREWWRPRRRPMAHHWM